MAWFNHWSCESTTTLRFTGSFADTSTDCPRGILRRHYRRGCGLQTVRPPSFPPLHSSLTDLQAAQVAGWLCLAQILALIPSSAPASTETSTASVSACTRRSLRTSRALPSSACALRWHRRTPAAADLAGPRPGISHKSFDDFFNKGLRHYQRFQSRHSRSISNSTISRPFLRWGSQVISCFPFPSQDDLLAAMNPPIEPSAPLLVALRAFDVSEVKGRGKNRMPG